MADARVQGYAAGIFEVAKGEGVLDKVEDELFRVARGFDGSTELRDALTNPRLPLERKLAVVDELLGTKAHPLTAGFVNFVVSLERAGDLSAIVDELVSRSAASRDKVVAEVRTAISLDDSTVERLAAALSRRTGRDVEVKVVIDPTVLGGIIAQVGDTVIDGSVKSRLQSVREALVG